MMPIRDRRYPGEMLWISEEKQTVERLSLVLSQLRGSKGPNTSRKRNYVKCVCSVFLQEGGEFMAGFCFPLPHFVCFRNTPSWMCGVNIIWVHDISHKNKDIRESTVNRIEIIPHPHPMAFRKILNIIDNTRRFHRPHYFFKFGYVTKCILAPSFHLLCCIPFRDISVLYLFLLLLMDVSIIPTLPTLLIIQGIPWGLPPHLCIYMIVSLGSNQEIIHQGPNLAHCLFPQIKVHWNTTPPTCLCFHRIMTALSTCRRDDVDCKTSNIYCSALCRKIGDPSLGALSRHNLRGGAESLYNVLVQNDPLSPSCSSSSAPPPRFGQWLSVWDLKNFPRLLDGPGICCHVNLHVRD